MAQFPSAGSKIIIALCLVLSGGAASEGRLAIAGEAPWDGFRKGVTVEPTGPTQPEDLRHADPGFLVRAEVNRASRSYRDGDTLSLTVASEADAYVYVLYKQADGKVFLVFPNSTRSENRIYARQAVRIPESDDLFRWTVGEPFGKEIIKVIASKQPIAELSEPSLREKFFNPVSTNQLKGVELELGRPKLAWAEDCVEIRTYAGQDPAEAAGARRFGVFVGVGHYQHIGKSRAGASGQRSQVFEPSHRDARLVSGMLQEVGRLSDLRLITYEEATRATIETAITRWLPEVSRPGDTVILFFSGMAMPIAHAAGHETPGVVLPCYEFMTADAMAQLQKQRRDGKIDKATAAQLEAAEQIVQRAGGPPQGTVAMVRQWGISDDRFAAWLRCLAGRQVIVLLDAPYAEAFATGSARGEGPMSEGLGRLAALGQREITLLGACGAERSEVLRNPQGLSLFSELLLQGLQAAPGTVNVAELHAYLEAKMAARVEEINRVLRSTGAEPVSYRPYFVTTGSQPAFLKP